jgi:hypothetical protein
MLLCQRVKTVTHVVELLNFIQDRVRMHGPRCLSRALSRPPHYTAAIPLHGYSDVTEGQGDGFKRLKLGRSIDESCTCSQYFWVCLRVVSLCIGFIVPEADRNRILAVGTCQCDFVLKALLLAK